MELGKLFFQFYGYLSDKLDFPGENGERTYMLRYDYLGGSIVIPCTAEELATAPAEGTLVRVLGVVKVDKNKGRITLKPLNFSIQGRDKDFVMPKDADLMAGAIFEGTIVMTSKDANLFEGKLYRSATVSMFGGAHKFTNLDTETYETFPESGLISISGKVDAKIISYKEDGRTYKRCENTLIPERVAIPQAEQKPSKAPAA